MNKFCTFGRSDNKDPGKVIFSADTMLLQGADMRIATCRAKLQNRRSKLNQEINKELRLRKGAENLFKATTCRKLRETVALELSFVNSNLQLLKEQLEELNSSVEIYQHEHVKEVMPMIPLGLKETKEVDFRDSFKDFILEHYSEDASQYENSIAEVMDTRQAMRTPMRDNSGVALLSRYYNHLYYIERRFFPPNRSLGIYFEWYDSLTGVPSCQRTVAFEKTCVLFNIGALYTQIGAKQDRITTKGLDAAVDSFLRAAGTFKYINENFTNAPSIDLGTDMLEMFMQLMLAQARECLLEKLDLQSLQTKTADIYFDLAQEAAYLSECYTNVYKSITNPSVKEYVPYSWSVLMQVKRDFYSAVAHHHIARGLLDKKNMASSITELSEFVYPESVAIQIDSRIPKSDADRKLLGRAHLKESLLLHEECQRHHRMCRELKGKQPLVNVLQAAHKDVMQSFSECEYENEFRDVVDTPTVDAVTKFQLSLTAPDFAIHRVNDLFRTLGPLAIFSAKRHWTAPRLIQLQRKNSTESFGFSLRGDAPVIVSLVEQNSVADCGGIKEGDFIVSIADEDVKWSSHEEVVSLIKQCADSLNMKLVTPMDINYLKVEKIQREAISPHNDSCTVASDISSPSSSVVQYSHYNRRLSWNPFKKNLSPKNSKDVYNIILG